jgi:hypothetical protein
MEMTVLTAFEEVSRTYILMVKRGLKAHADAVPFMGEAPRFFVEMFIDNNLRAGADSVQTFFGIDLDLKKAFGR